MAIAFHDVMNAVPLSLFPGYWWLVLEAWLDSTSHRPHVLPRVGPHAHSISLWEPWDGGLPHVSGTDVALCPRLDLCIARFSINTSLHLLFFFFFFCIRD
ncbi:hypothetical protein H1C71_012249 [Ictidomys tridecemlineatus]|nr:hypothetical protein H1C71_012249 [Ictidomys tridecemlineatus]